MKMKRLISVVMMIVILAATLTGCAGQNGAVGDSTKKISDSGDIKVATFVQGGEPVSDWDPAISYCGDPHVFCNVYETLLRYDANTDKYIKVLASEYTSSKDGLTWTFKIRKGVKFHDGTDCNAEAVKFSIDRNKGMQQGAAYIWDAVKEIKVIDDYTVEFDLSRPADMEEVTSCSFDAFIYSPIAVGKDYNAGSTWFYKGNMCGTGPYKLQSFTSGSEVVLTKFEDYWGGWEGEHFDKVVFKVASEASTRRQMIESGEADFSIELQSADLDALSSVKGVRVEVAEAAANIICFFNMLNKPLDNILVRKALAYTFPYSDAIKYVKKGKYGSLATDVVAPGNVRGATKSVPYTYDIEKARSLLKGAGYADGFSVEVTIANSANDAKTMLELWKSELAKLNITLDIQVGSWDALFSRAKGDAGNRQDIYVTEQTVDTMVSYGVYATTCMTGGAWNFASFSDPDIDKALVDAYSLSLFNRDESTKQLQEVGKRIADECFVINLCDRKHGFVMRDDFKGFVHNAAYDQVVFFYDCYRQP